MPGEKTTAPDVLPSGAKAIYKSAFNGAHGGSCSERGDEREACAARIAWTAVKEKYVKNADGDWIAKAFEDAGFSIDGIPLPGSLVQSPFPAALAWVQEFKSSYEQTNDIAESASRAWAALKEKYEQSSDEGTWTLRTDIEEEQGEAVERVSEEAPEVERAELVIHRHAKRSGLNFQSGEGAIIVDNLEHEEEVALLQRGYGKRMAACPAELDGIAWSDRPAISRTVEAVIRDKWISRAYTESVEQYITKGFTVKANPSNSAEQILFGDIQIGDNEPFKATGVLTRKADMVGISPDDWQFRALMRGFASSFHIRVPTTEARFRGPVLR